MVTCKMGRWLHLGNLGNGNQEMVNQREEVKTCSQKGGLESELHMFWFWENGSDVDGFIFN